MPAARASRPPPTGLGALRRIGAVSDLLFLYECATREVVQLKGIAARLGLTVQAASHTFRGLARRGLVEFRDGRYRPTVRGVDELHSSLGSVRDDLATRIDRLHIVRTTRAIAGAPIAAGASVVLALEDGLLTARPSTTGASQGRANRSARRGDLVEVTDLKGIVPLEHGRLGVVAVPLDRCDDASLVPALARTLRRRGNALLAAHGLEPYHLVRRAMPYRPVVRLGIVPTVREATALGLDCTVVVLDRDVPRLFEQMADSGPIPFDFLTVRPPARRRRAARGPKTGELAEDGVRAPHDPGPRVA